MGKIFQYVAPSLLAILTLPIVLFGLQCLSIWIRICLGFSFYHSSYEYYLFLALFMLIPSTFGLWIISKVVFSEKARALLLVPFFIVLLEAIQLPSFMKSASLRVELRLKSLALVSSRWAEHNGRVPETEAEINSAESQYWHGKTSDMSFYSLGRQPLPYKLVILQHRSGPVLDSSQLTQPAIIFYAVSEDGATAWLTGSALAGQFTGKIQFVSTFRYWNLPFVEVAGRGGSTDWR
jgi:hypothetical protein